MGRKQSLVVAIIGSVLLGSCVVTSVADAQVRWLALAVTSMLTARGWWSYRQARRAEAKARLARRAL